MLLIFAPPPMLRIVLDLTSNCLGRTLISDFAPFASGFEALAAALAFARARALAFVIIVSPFRRTAWERCQSIHHSIIRLFADKFQLHTNSTSFQFPKERCTGRSQFIAPFVPVFPRTKRYSIKLAPSQQINVRHCQSNMIEARVVSTLHKPWSI